MSVMRRVEEEGRARVDREEMYVSRRLGGSAQRKLLVSSGLDASADEAG
jgi:hypothetical protein